MSRRTAPVRPPLRPLVIACWVALAAVVAYLPVVRNGYVYDDVEVLPGNSGLSLLARPSTYFSPQYFAAAHEATYRPLVSVTYGIEYLLCGKASPVVSHVFNLLLHAVASALLIPVCLSLGASPPVALVAGLLYATHPLRSEAVCSPGFREDLICAIFYLAGFALWPAFGRKMAATVSPSPPATRAGGHRDGAVSQTAEASAVLFALGAPARIAWAFVCFALAMLSKEMALSFPLLVLAKDAPGVGAEWRRSGFVRRRLPWHALLWVLTAAGLWLFLGFHSEEAGFVQENGTYFPNATLPQRLAGLAWTAVRYLALFVVPYPLSVEHLVDLQSPLLWPLAGASALLLAALGLFAFRRRAAFPAGWQAFVAFVLLLGPVSNVIRLMHPMAERYLTLPLGAGCYVAAALLDRWRAVGARRAVVGVLVGVYCLLSWQRCAEWESPLTLWQAEVGRGSRSCVVHNNLGVALGNIGHAEESIAQFQEAVRLASDYHEGFSNLGNACGKAGRLPEAEKALRRAIALDSGAGLDHALLAVILGQTNRANEALRECALAIENAHDVPSVYSTVGDLYLRMGREAEGRRVLEKALTLARRVGDAATERTVLQSMSPQR